MSKRIQKIILLGLCLLLLTSCKSTPEDAVVIKKDSDKVIQKAAENSGKAYTAPDKMKQTLENKTKNLSVSIDVDVKMKKNIDYPVVEVEKREFTQEEADRYLDTFIGKKTFYKVPEDWTKSEIENRIIELKKMLADDKDAVADNGKKVSTVIKDLRKKMDTAPKEDPVENASKKFIASGQQGGKRIFGYCNEEDGRKAYLSISNSCDGNTVEAIYTRFENENQEDYTSINTSDYTSNIKFEKLKLSKDDAETEAVDLLNKLQIKGFEPRKVSLAIDSDTAATYNNTKKKATVKTAYMVLFTKSYNGMPAVVQDTIGTVSRMNGKSIETIEGKADLKGTDEQDVDEEYAKQWYYETVAVFIDDSGIVGFHYQSPSNISKVVTKSSSLLAFQDVEKIIKKMMLVKYQVADEAKMTIKGKRLELSLARIKEKNQDAKGIFVPVWTLYGDTVVYYDKNKTGPKDEQEKAVNTEILSINAVDGSMIHLNEFDED
ncbi:hypothetical protein lbkm_4167 [Lachnospiraceae bacterium KM106-2]|nr:hypothetical protein lbkm_4167 [Lachnospiraceae bacterium KM106-2]